jgi:hypothetical protein
VQEDRRTGAAHSQSIVRLAEIGGLSLSDLQIDLLADVNEFNIEGRYPELLMPPPTRAEADEYMARIAEELQCLNSLF